MPLSEREKLLLTLFYLLRTENEALRSVISEFSADEPTQYTQFVRAQLIRQAIETLEHLV